MIPLLRLPIALALALAAVLSTQADDRKDKLTPDELVLRGRYAEVPAGTDARGKALWAFARYQLAPSGKIYDAAMEAHRAGEVLGTFLVIQCHKDGVGVRRDEKLMWKLHLEFRTGLEKKVNPTPLELYLLSQTDLVGANGLVTMNDPADLPKIEAKNTKLKLDRLTKAAEGGMAEAYYQLGMAALRGMNEVWAMDKLGKAADLGPRRSDADKGGPTDGERRDREEPRSRY